MLRRIVMVVIACAVAACTSPAATPTDSIRSPGANTVLPSPAHDEPSAGPIIVKLRLRDVDLTIESSARGPRFVVSSIDGAIIERDLEDRELAARYPDLYRMYRSALVKAKGTYLDARLDSARDRGAHRAGQLRR